jgi:hypothetical protein
MVRSATRSEPSETDPGPKGPGLHGSGFYASISNLKTLKF